MKTEYTERGGFLQRDDVEHKEYHFRLVLIRMFTRHPVGANCVRPRAFKERPYEIRIR